MQELKNSIRQLIASTPRDTAFADLLAQFCQTLERHPQALGQLAGSYRLTATDTGVTTAFLLGDHSFTPLPADAKVDAAISAKEADLMALIRHELKPMPAIFTGRLRVQGSMKALEKFAQVL